MTEVAVEYKTDKRAGVTWNHCPRCNAIYGFEVEDGAFLRVGKLKVKSIHAECGECGNPIWWCSSDRHIKRIIQSSEV